MLKKLDGNTLGRIAIVIVACALILFFSPYGPKYPVPRAVALILFAALSVLSLLSRNQRYYHSMIQALASPKKNRTESKGSLVLFFAGFFLVLCTLSFLEWRQPFYFVEDDNHAQFLPVILQACRGFLSGVFPTWNPYQFLGLPTTSVGIYSLTYPVTYFSYFTSIFFFRTEFLTFEIFAFLHILAGYVTSFRLFRRLNLTTFESVGGAVCFSLSGYHLVAGRSWYYMLPVAVYAPWLLMKLVDLKDNSKLSMNWVFSTGLLIGLWYHSGNVQMWTYGLISTASVATLWFLCGQLPFKKVIWLMIPATIGIAIALPLLYLQLTEASHRVMSTVGYTINGGLANLFLPPPFFESGYPGINDLNDPKSAMFFSGGVFFIGFIIAFLTLSGLILGHAKVKPFLKEQSFTVVTLIIFIFALGDQAALWSVFSVIPPFNKFNMAFKLLGFLSLFSIVSGLLFIHGLSSLNKKYQIISNAVVVLGVALTLLNCHEATYSFYNYADHPYPSLPRSLQRFTIEQNKEYRLFPVGPTRSLKPDYVFNLVSNYPTVYGIMAFEGYDTIASTLPDFTELSKMATANRQIMGEYGVKWIVSERHEPLRDIAGLKPVLEWSDFKVQELPGALPIVFEEKTKRSESFQLRADGFDLNLQPSAGERTIVAGFLARPWLRAFDTEGRELIVTKDSRKRIAITVPASSNFVAIRYALPWKIPTLISLAVIALALAMATKLKARFQ